MNIEKLRQCNIVCSTGKQKERMVKALLEAEEPVSYHTTGQLGLTNAGTLSFSDRNEWLGYGKHAAPKDRTVIKFSDIVKEES